MLSAFVLFTYFFTFVRLDNSLIQSEDEELFIIQPRGTFAQLRTFGIKERVKMVNLHNEERRQVVPSANNMKELRWDNGLEALAADYVKGCEYKHSDASYRTRRYNFTFIGENIWIVNTQDVTLDYAAEGAVKAWANEKRYYDVYSKTCLDVCGHYTQMVWGTTYAVGCAVADCTNVKVGGTTWSTATMLICHYGPTGNINGYSAYDVGNPCTKCKSGYECHDKLCGEPGIELYSGGLFNKAGPSAIISVQEVSQITTLAILAQLWHL